MRGFKTSHLVQLKRYPIFFQCLLAVCAYTSLLGPAHVCYREALSSYAAGQYLLAINFRQHNYCHNYSLLSSNSTSQIDSMSTVHSLHMAMVPLGSTARLLNSVRTVTHWQGVKLAALSQTVWANRKFQRQHMVHLGLSEAETIGKSRNEGYGFVAPSPPPLPPPRQGFSV